MYSFAVLAAAALASSQFKTFEHFPVSSDDWKIVSKADQKSSIDLKIAIKNSNMDNLVSKLYAVSDPSSAHYGRHLSKQQVDSLIAPSQESFEEVKSWLYSVGVTEMHVSNDFISATIAVAKAQEILNAQYFVYESDETRLIRTETYSLPENLHRHVDFVQPTTMFSKFHEAPIENSFMFDEEAAIDGPLAGCTNRMTIKCLNTLYNMTYTPSGKTKIGVTGKLTLFMIGYLGQYANKNDLTAFMTKYHPSAKDYQFEFQSVSNGTNPQGPGTSGIEAALDVQYVVGLTYPSKTIFYSTAGSPPFIPDSITPTNTNEPYLDWLIYMSGLSDDEIPSVVTTSYGDNEQTVPITYATRVCNEFAKLGARGVSILFSSGDGGVAGSQVGDCRSNDGKKTIQFLPTFPASCPFVTSVGGTHKIPESAVDFSSGGFSNYFTRPDYQSSAVGDYLKSIGDQYKGLYNTSGRGLLVIFTLGFRMLLPTVPNSRYL